MNIVNRLLNAPWWPMVDLLIKSKGVYYNIEQRENRIQINLDLPLTDEKGTTDRYTIRIVGEATVTRNEGEKSMLGELIHRVRNSNA